MENVNISNNTFNNNFQSINFLPPYPVDNSNNDINQFIALQKNTYNLINLSAEDLYTYQLLVYFYGNQNLYNIFKNNITRSDFVKLAAHEPLTLVLQDVVVFYDTRYPSIKEESFSLSNILYIFIPLILLYSFGLLYERTSEFMHICFITLCILFFSYTIDLINLFILLIFFLNPFIYIEKEKLNFESKDDKSLSDIIKEEETDKIEEKKILTIKDSYSFIALVIIILLFIKYLKYYIFWIINCLVYMILLFNKFHNLPYLQLLDFVMYLINVFFFFYFIKLTFLPNSFQVLALCFLCLALNFMILNQFIFFYIFIVIAIIFLFISFFFKFSTYFFIIFFSLINLLLFFYNEESTNEIFILMMFLPFCSILKIQSIIVSMLSIYLFFDDNKIRRYIAIIISMFLLILITILMCLLDNKGNGQTNY